MDWKKFKDSMTPYVNKAKEYWQKAVDFAENQIQTTPLFIKSQNDYDGILTEKRVIILAYDDTDEFAKDVQLYSTVWLTRAFLDVAKCRFLNIKEFPDLAQNLGLVWPVDMRVRFEWEETYRITNGDDIKKWWKATSYKKTETDNSTTKETPFDPLATK